MSRRAVRESGRKSGSICFVLLLLLASLTGLISLPGASANVSGDLALIDTNSPVEDSWSSSWENINFNVTITNEGLQSITSRDLRWYACEGEVDVNSCKSNYVELEAFPSRQFTLGLLQIINHRTHGIRLEMKGSLQSSTHLLSQTKIHQMMN